MDPRLIISVRRMKATVIGTPKIRITTPDIELSITLEIRKPIGTRKKMHSRACVAVCVTKL